MSDAKLASVIPVDSSPSPLTETDIRKNEENDDDDDGVTAKTLLLENKERRESLKERFSFLQRTCIMQVL